MSWWDIDDPARIIDALGAQFARIAQGMFDDNMQVHTIALCAAQDWFAAVDFVQVTHAFSRSTAVPWPHDCDADDDFSCHRCGPELDHDDWLPDTPAVFDAVRPFCPYSLAGDSLPCRYLPLFVARRGRDSAEFVGQLQRPWLRPDLSPSVRHSPEVTRLLSEVYRAPDDDEPRHMLADHLQTIGEPWGEFIALQLDPDFSPAKADRCAQLEIAHRNTILGRLLPISIPGLCVFERGFVDRFDIGEVEPEVILAVADAPEWATVTCIRFPFDVDQRVVHRWPMIPAFLRIREIEAPAHVLYEMANAGPWAFEELDCGIDELDFECLARLQCPHLRRLSLYFHSLDVQELLSRRTELAWWDALTHFDLFMDRRTPETAALVKATSARLHICLATEQLIIRAVAGIVTVHAVEANPTRAAVVNELRLALGPGWRVDVGVCLPADDVANATFHCASITLCGTLDRLAE